ncbi:MAG TPA: hypothetical protein PKY30_07485, partial [Myxococcota bacterium]|nr:hypothetical protein [Myxococcota bacterium]
KELGLPQRYGCTVVAMSLWDPELGDWQRQAVDVDRPLHAEDRLILIGPTDTLKVLAEEEPAEEV